MLSKHTEKSHSVKWVEAERELAVRGIVFPSPPINHEHLVVQKDIHSPRDIHLPPVPAAPKK